MNGTKGSQNEQTTKVIVNFCHNLTNGRRLLSVNIYNIFSLITLSGPIETELCLNNSWDIHIKKSLKMPTGNP